MPMNITQLNSFNTSYADTRGALINFMLATKDGQGYSRIDQQIKSSLDSGRLIGGTDELNEATDKSNYRNTDAYREFTYELIRAMVLSYIKNASKMSASLYDKSVKMVLIWLAYTEYWRLLIMDEDDKGNPIEPIYPKEYGKLAGDLYLLVSSKDDRTANELKDEAEKLGYNNLAKIVEDLGSEVFYMTITRSARNQWEAIVNRYGPIEQDQDKYGQGPSKLYQKYYQEVTGRTKVEYSELVDVYNKLYPDDEYNANIVSKFFRSNIVPYMITNAQSDPEVMAIKSLMVNED